MGRIIEAIIIGTYFLLIILFILVMTMTIMMSTRSPYVELTLERIVPVKKTVIGKTFLLVPAENTAYTEMDRRIVTNKTWLYFSLPSIGSSLDALVHDRIIDSISTALKESKITAVYIDQTRNEKENYSSDPNFMKLKGWYRANEPSSINGMDRYYQEHVQINDPTYSKPVFYLPTGTENRVSLYLECSAIPDPKNPFCTLYDLNFPHGMSGYITIPLKDLNDWNSIHSRVIERLNEFIRAGDERVEKKQWIQNK